MLALNYYDLGAAQNSRPWPPGTLAGHSPIQDLSSGK